MKHFLLFLLVLIALASCGPRKPESKDVFVKVVGNYCSENLRLELRPDSSFFSMKISPGKLAGKPLVEKCSGKFSLIFDETAGTWKLKFNQDGRGMKIATCNAETTIWSKSEGWLTGDSTLTMKELIGSQEVIKGNCEI